MFAKPEQEVYTYQLQIDRPGDDFPAYDIFGPSEEDDNDILLTLDYDDLKRLVPSLSPGTERVEVTFRIVK